MSQDEPVIPEYKTPEVPKTVKNMTKDEIIESLDQKTLGELIDIYKTACEMNEMKESQILAGLDKLNPRQLAVLYKSYAPLILTVEQIVKNNSRKTECNSEFVFNSWFARLPGSSHLANYDKAILRRTFKAGRDSKPADPDGK